MSGKLTWGSGFSGTNEEEDLTYLGVDSMYVVVWID